MGSYQKTLDERDSSVSWWVCEVCGEKQINISLSTYGYKLHNGEKLKYTICSDCRPDKCSWWFAKKDLYKEQIKEYKIKKMVVFKKLVPDLINNIKSNFKKLSYDISQELGLARQCLIYEIPRIIKQCKNHNSIYVYWDCWAEGMTIKELEKQLINSNSLVKKLEKINFIKI